MTTPPTVSAAPSARTDQSAPENMLGHGFYNKHSHSQGAANAYALPLLKEAVQGIGQDQGAHHFVIADYGSAQGRNSLEPIKTVIQAIKHRWQPSPAVTVFHTDLPTNDFTALFETVQSSESYLAGEKNVFAFASGTSIYQQIFPAAYVALGYSAIAVHWLSRKPSDIPGHVWSTRAKDQVREQWAEQARADWHAFLRHRATELRESGRLVIVGSGADSAGNSGAEALMDLGNDVLQQMAAEGLLTRDELTDMVIPTYYRTPREWTDCLAPHSPFAQETGLQLLREETAVLADPYFEDFQKTGDAKTFAHAYATFLRAFSEPCLFKSLRADRAAASKERIANSFYSRVESAIAAAPEKVVCRWQLMLLVIAKMQSR